MARKKKSLDPNQGTFDFDSTIKAYRSLKEELLTSCHTGNVIESYEEACIEVAAAVKRVLRASGMSREQLVDAVNDYFGWTGNAKKKKLTIHMLNHPTKRIYSLHEKSVAAIKKGKRHPPCEFGALVALAMNDDGLILAHKEYQRNIADVKTMGPVITRIKENIGQVPWEVAGDRGFDNAPEKQEKCRRRWGVKRIAIPKKGKKPHPKNKESWFQRVLKQRVKIEPVIGHLKSDHRMNRCRYKGTEGDTTNVTWAS